MDDIGKQEGGTVNQTQQLECLQEPNPVSVSGAISEMQKNVGDSGGPVDLDPNVPKTPEDAKIGTDPNNESNAETQSDKIESNVEVSLKIESGQNGEKGEAVKDSVISPVGNVDGVRLSEVSVKIGSEENGENGESVKNSMDLDASRDTDNPVGNVDGVHCESEASVKTLNEENVEKGESVKESKELDASVETDNLVGNVDGVHRESEVSVKIGSDENGEKGKALKDSMNLDTTEETDNPVCNVDGVQILSKENIEKEEAVKDSMELDVSAETDNPVGNVDGVHCESEVSVKIGSEENGQKGEAMKDFIELHASAETDNLVSYRDGGSHHTVVTVVSMEIEKEDNNGEEGKALKDGESSKPNPSAELHISAEKDNVSQVEPDKRPDSEVKITKLMDGVSNKANPSNDLVRTDKSVRKLEPDIRDSEVAREKLVDGVSIKANPSKQPLNSDETYEAVRKLEPYMPRYSKVAREKLVDGVINKAKPFTSEPPSNAKGNNLCNVERKLPLNNEVAMETETETDDDDEKGDTLTGSLSRKTKLSLHHDIKQEAPKPKLYVGQEVGMRSLESERTFLLDPNAEGDESGTEEEQTEFLKEVENFYKERHLEFKPPKFYKEGLNLLKLWRAVIKLGGYEKVTSCKLWREVGQSFNPPKTCTTVSWTFRIFYEKALLEFEKERWHGNELSLLSEPSRADIRVDGSQNVASGRTLRDAAARAMQGWHSQRHFNGEDKHLSTMPKSDKQLKSSGLLKRKKLSPGDCSAQVTDMKAMKPRLDMMVFDIGPPADWVKINVKRFNDCFEVYALVPGLLREEVHVQSDPIGRLVISGQPMQMDNPWGVTPFKKVVSLPSRIDPHQTSAVVTLNGQLFVRVPFEQSDF